MIAQDRADDAREKMRVPICRERLYKIADQLFLIVGMISDRTIESFCIMCGAHI